MSIQAVVDGYTGRAAFYAAETHASIVRPRHLSRLLSEARHVAELPCATGHFLENYVTAGVETTLIDANAHMVEAALERAQLAGISREHQHGRVHAVQDLGDMLARVDLLVMPNGSFGQLACQMPLLRLLDALVCALDSGGRLLAQVLCSKPDGDSDTCGFYDPLLPHDQWFDDRPSRRAPADPAGVRPARRSASPHQ